MKVWKQRTFIFDTLTVYGITYTEAKRSTGVPPHCFVIVIVIGFDP